MFNKILDFTRTNKKKMTLSLVSITSAIVVVGIIGGSIDHKEVVTVQPVREVVQVTKVAHPPEHNDYITGMINQYVEQSNLLVTAYQLCINGQQKIIVRTKEELELVLELVQQGAVGEKAETKVVLSKEDEVLQIATSVTERPKLQVAMMDFTLTTAGLDSNPVQTRIKPSTIINNAIALDMSSKSGLINAKEATSNEQIKSIEFSEELEISKIEVSKDELLTVDEAVAILNSTNIAPTTYTVEPGDSPYEIALDNDMKLEELYELNEDLETKAKGLQVGDEVIIMVPEPELSVIVEETMVYYDIIPKEITYIDDDSIFVGKEVVSEVGLDGTKEVTAIVKMQNSKELSREIISETVITGQEPSIVLKGTKPLPLKGPTGTLSYPLNSFKITSRFGARWGGFHLGVDLATSTGSTVYAADGGTVTKAGWHGGYGYLVEIDHGNGVMTRYGHNSSVSVTVGQVVGKKDVIAKSGSTGNSTGPHVHFEVLINGENVDPLKYVN